MLKLGNCKKKGDVMGKIEIGLRGRKKKTK
jgi:hypothetical protein